MFGHKIWKTEGWFWFGRAGPSDGKYIVEDSHERVLQFAQALEDAVNRGYIKCLKYPVIPDAPSRSVLIAFCDRKQVDGARAQLTAAGIQKMLWTWDNRSIDQISYQRGHHLPSQYLGMWAGQLHLFKSLIEFWCTLLRVHANLSAKFVLQLDRSPYRITATVSRKQSLFRKQPCLEVRYETEIAGDISLPESRSLTIRYLDDSLRAELPHAIRCSNKELENITHRIVYEN